MLFFISYHIISYHINTNQYQYYYSFSVPSLYVMFCGYLFQALAPGADTFFYSFSDLNPDEPSNEGFLAYLAYVSAEKNPPLVHSLSYGDVEATVFDADSDYGQRWE